VVMARAASPWGPATVVDELHVAQEADGKTFTTVVQLLESSDGEALVRFAYTTDGIARRGPVTLRAADAKRLRKALAKSPQLGGLLGVSAM
jgi:hypothetical protein